MRANIFHLRYIMQLYLKHARVTLCNRIAIYREKFESSDCTAHARVMTFLKVITSQELVDILSVWSMVSSHWRFWIIYLSYRGVSSGIFRQVCDACFCLYVCLYSLYLNECIQMPTKRNVSVWQANVSQLAWRFIIIFKLNFLHRISVISYMWKWDWYCSM